METTEQIEKWNGKFGKNYTKRNASVKNNYNISRSELNKIFLDKMDRNI